jgi:hypothetical protein
MKRILITFLTGAAFAAVPPVLAATSHEHEHDHAAHARLALDGGKKWQTDEALRREMEGLRYAIDYARQPNRPRAEYQALGQVVEYRVGRIVEECKLAPEADKNLHVVVAELVASADALQAAKGSHARKAVRRASVALNDYGAHFDHPGWKPLR